MIEAILNPYIANIPWDRFGKTFIEENTARYAQNIEYILGEHDKIPFRINFDDDIWDFAPFRPDACENITITFERANPCYKDFLKLFTIQRFTERIGIRSMRGQVEALMTILNSILDEKRIRSISLITDEDLVNSIERTGVCEKTKSTRLLACAMFFSVIESEFRIPILVDTEVLFDESKCLKRKYVEQRTPTIPDEYFGLIMDTCRKALYDESLPYDLRMTAGLLINEGQTGIRTEDLLNLKMSDVKQTVFGDRTFHYLEFETRKPSRSDSYFKKARCRLNETCMQAIQVMEVLGREKRKEAPYDFVYTLGQSIRPVTKVIFVNRCKALLYTMIPEAVTKPWEGIKPSKFRGQTVYVPTTRQYRVFACSDLYRKGASLLNIRRSMGHLSAAMEGYYVRQKETWQESRAEAAKQIIKAVSDEKTIPLGNHTASRMNDIIGRIVDDTKVNIAGSNEEILETLGKKLIVRTKPGGYCIRTGRTCAEDYRTDQTLCAYDECPNIYYFYFNLSTAYEDMRNAETTYQQALDVGHKREAEKEQYKIVNIARRRIIPMLDELERMLTASTPEQIEERHPGMAETIRKKDEIRKEAMDWIARSE